MADNALGLLFEINADPSRAEAALGRLETSTSQSVKKQVAQFDSLAQAAGTAFRQMAGAASGAGGTMLQVFDLVAGNILHGIDLERLSVGEFAKGEAAKAASSIQGIKDVAIVRALEETAEGIAALARFQLHEAALHFLSAAKFGAISAVEIAPLVGGDQGSVRGPGRESSRASGSSSPIAPITLGAASAASPPGGNVTVMVMGEPQAAAWLTRVINNGVVQQDMMLVASHTKRSAPAGR